MSIGLVLAMKAEARAVLGRGRWRGGHRACGLRRVQGPKGGELIAALCGVGRDRAVAGAGLLLDEGVGALIGVGISGGLSQELKAGDLVLASEVLDEGKVVYKTTGEGIDFALKTLTARGINVRQGSIVSTSNALLTADAKHDIYEKTGALAVDMESAGLAAVAVKKGVPFFILRAICDDAGEALSPDLYACLSEGGGVRPGQLIGSCIRRPAMVAEMMRLRRSYNLALSALAHGWQALQETGLPYFLLEKRK